MVREDRRHDTSARALRTDADREGPQAPKDQPRVEGRCDRAPDVADMTGLLQEGAAPGEDQGATRDVTVPSDVFRRGVEDDVGPQLERPLQDRRCESVVHENRRAARSRPRRGHAEIGDLHQRVRRRFDPDERRSRAERPVEGSRVVHRNEVGPHAPLGQQVGGGHPVAVVDVVGEEDPGTRRERLEKGDARRHPRREDERGLPSLGGGEGRLDPILRRVRLPDVCVPPERRPIRVPGEGRREDEGRGHRPADWVHLGARVEESGLDSHRHSVTLYAAILVIGCETIGPCSDSHSPLFSHSFGLRPPNPQHRLRRPLPTSPRGSQRGERSWPAMCGG